MTNKFDIDLEIQDPSRTDVMKSTGERRRTIRLQFRQAAPAWKKILPSISLFPIPFLFTILQVAFFRNHVFSGFPNTSLRLAPRFFREIARCLKHVRAVFLEFTRKTRFYFANTSLCAFFTHDNPMLHGNHFASRRLVNFRRFDSLSEAMG
jgi:hypothetical protein